MHANFEEGTILMKWNKESQIYSAKKALKESVYRILIDL